MSDSNGVPQAQHAAGAPEGDAPAGGAAPGAGVWLLLIAAAAVPTLFFAIAVALSAAESPGVSLGAWWGRVAGLTAATLALAAVLLFAAWLVLRRARAAAERSLAERRGRRSREDEAALQSQKLDALARLTGGVAHDFNNLLMVINNNAYLLKRVDAGPAAAQRIGAIERAVESGTKLTRQLLSFSGRQAWNPELMRLQDELPSLIELMRPALGARITVTTQIDPDAAPVRVDRAELELALLNLAENASDAMASSGQLLVALRNAAAGDAPGAAGPQVVISVGDTGAGMPKDVQDRAFEPFFSTKPVGKGTGLGLSQVYGFCQQSGGTARVESKPGEGTTVRLYLPAASEPIPPKEQVPAADLDDLAGRCVLMVEDNDDVAETTRQLLEFLGCEVTRAASGNAAVMRLERDNLDFDIVISDIVMPGGLSGIEVMHYVRDRYAHLPVMLMTGYASELQKLSPDETVLLKPFTPEKLAAAMRRAFERHQTERMGAT